MMVYRNQVCWKPFHHERRDAEWIRETDFLDILFNLEESKGNLQRDKSLYGDQKPKGCG